MKHIIISISIALLTQTIALGQAYFRVLEPQNIEGEYLFRNSINDDNWGADVYDTWTEGQLALALDSTAADSTCCSTIVNTSEVSGKIALIYRGACDYSTQALNAQNAGAIACVLVNTEEFIETLTEGSNGSSVTIPVVMITREVASQLREEMITSNVEIAIGNPQDVYITNVGSCKGSYSTSRFGSMPTAIAEYPDNHRLTPEIKVFNWGADMAGIDVEVTATIDRDGNVQYTESQTVFIPYEDSIQISFTPYEETNGLLAGQYHITYELIPLNGLNPIIDEFIFDNILSAAFWINDDFTFSRSRIDPIEGPKRTGYIKPGTNEWEWCIAVNPGDHEGAYLKSMTAAASSEQGVSLSGYTLEMNVYRWDDPVTSSVTFDNLVELSADEYYDYSSNQQDVFVTKQFEYPILLDTNTNYLACVYVFDDELSLAYDNAVNFSSSYANYPAELSFPFGYNGEGFDEFPQGFGLDIVPAFVLDISCLAESTTSVNSCDAYEWNGTVYDQSGTYTYHTTSVDGCDSTAILNLTLDEPLAVPICAVGVDENGNNRVVWEKPQISGIDSFYVYKESQQAGIYDYIGGTAYEDTAIFADVNANPSIQAYRYKISTVDSCGFESELSEEHKTIHLTINQGVGQDWNLIWSSYEGFEFLDYEIYRGTDPNSMSLLTTLASNLNSYTDQTAPSGIIYYQVVAINPNGCDPTRASAYASSKSNLATTEPSGINDVEMITANIRPNPSSNQVTITFNRHIESNFWLVDKLGRVVLTEQLNSDKKMIDISHLPVGVYTIRFDNEKIAKGRVVKN